MMANLFDHPDGNFIVLMNDEEQYSMWPEEIDVPGGWVIVYGTESRSSCQQYIEANWTDLRPKSLRKNKQEI